MAQQAIHTRQRRKVIVAQILLRYFTCIVVRNRARQIYLLVVRSQARHLPLLLKEVGKGIR